MLMARQADPSRFPKTPKTARQLPLTRPKFTKRKRTTNTTTPRVVPVAIAPAFSCPPVIVAKRGEKLFSPQLIAALGLAHQGSHPSSFLPATFETSPAQQECVFPEFNPSTSPAPLPLPSSTSRNDTTDNSLSSHSNSLSDSVGSLHSHSPEYSPLSLPSISSFASVIQEEPASFTLEHFNQSFAQDQAPPPLSSTSSCSSSPSPSDAEPVEPKVTPLDYFTGESVEGQSSRVPPRIRHLFVYGDLRPDDKSSSWSSFHDGTMNCRPAIINKARLYWDNYPSVVLEEEAENEFVRGYVLSIESNDSLWEEKLRQADSITGYPHFFKRTATVCALTSSFADFHKAPTVPCFVHHRPDACKRIHISGGDWVEYDRMIRGSFVRF